MYSFAHVRTKYKLYIQIVVVKLWIISVSIVLGHLFFVTGNAEKARYCFIYRDRPQTPRLFFLAALGIILCLTKIKGLATALTWYLSSPRVEIVIHSEEGDHSQVQSINVTGQN